MLWYEADNAPEIDGVKVFQNVRNLKAIGKDYGGEELLDKIEFDYDGGHQELDLAVMFVEGAPVPSANWLEGSGIEFENGFVKVNYSYMTTVPGILGAGDITGKTSNYEDAKNQATKVGGIISDFLATRS